MLAPILEIIKNFTPTMTMAWGLVFLGVIGNVAGSSMAKLANGFNNWPCLALAVVFYSVAMVSALLAFKSMHYATVVAVLNAGAIALASVVGILFFREAFSLGQCIAFALIMSGIGVWFTASRFGW